MKRIIIPNAEAYLAAIPAEIKQTGDARYAHRLEVVCFVLKGHSPDEAANFFHHSPRSIHNWLHRMANQGLHGLDDVSPPGRPPRLAKEQMERLHQDLRHSPRELGYDQNLWDGILLSHHLDQKYSVALSVRSCQLLFKQLDFSLQRPRHKDR
ncbi:MAG: helix-turn-helix domain-containing protein [Dehalococcoidales bacterium]|nr:helix-turn-helix domain-containing protein [Dehalococcoidales bacterium]